MTSKVRCCRLAAAAFSRGGLGGSLGVCRAQTQQGSWQNLQERAWASGPSSMARGNRPPLPSVPASSRQMAHAKRRSSITESFEPPGRFCLPFSTSAALCGSAQGASDPNGPRRPSAAPDPSLGSTLGPGPQGAKEVPGPEQDSLKGRILDVARDAAKSVFFAALLAHLRQEAPTVEQEMLRELLEAKFQATWQRHKKRAQGASAGPVTAACLVVTANHVAGPWLGREPERFRETLLLLLGGKTAAAFGFMHRLSLMLRRDKVAYVGSIMDKLSHDWGPAFVYERSRGPGREQMRVTRCAYTEILEEEGAGSLTPIFCALERQWFDTLRLSRSNVAFRVPSRLADGDAFCLFEATQE